MQVTDSKSSAMEIIRFWVGSDCKAYYETCKLRKIEAAYYPALEREGFE